MLMRASKKIKLPHVRLQQTQMGAFHSTKNFESFESGDKMVRKFPGKSSRKFGKLLNFRKANHSTEIPGNFGMKVKWKENFNEKNWRILGIPHEAVLVFRNLCKVPTYFSARASSFDAITASWTTHARMAVTRIR